MTQPTLTYDGRPASPDGWRIVLRGLQGRCPRCGEGRLFTRYLKVAPSCTACGQEFHHHRADDFPPYIVMFIVGHLLGYGLYTVETRFDGFPLWRHALLWPTLAIGLCLGLLQPVKGFVVALQYALGMHGFEREGASSAGRGWEAGGERERDGAADDAVVRRRQGADLAEPGS